MNEISPEESEAIIDAAADGVTAGAHAPLGEMLTSLHAPADALGSAPAISMASRNVTGRIARRTAVAASIAVLGLASVAAAATGTIDLLDPLLGDDGPTFAAVADDEEEEEVPASTTTVEEDDGDEAVGDDDEVLEGGDDTEPAGQRAEIEGVDPSYGLSDEELTDLCFAAENHGHYVSSVARDKETETDETHGDRVSEAAHSDCGKDIDAESVDVESGDDESDDDESDDDESDDDESDDDDDDESDGPGNGRGRGHEKGNGNGHENGNGHRDDD
jgi:hypothetical protein